MTGFFQRYSRAPTYIRPRCVSNMLIKWKATPVLNVFISFKIKVFVNVAVSNTSSCRRFRRSYFPHPHGKAVRNSNILFICSSFTSARRIGFESFSDSEQASRKDVKESSSEICLRECGKQDRQSMYNITLRRVRVVVIPLRRTWGPGNIWLEKRAFVAI